MRFALLISSLVLLLSACETPQQIDFAYKPKTTNSQKSNDQVDCLVVAAKEVPANQQIATTPVYTTPTYITPITTSCYGYSCTTSGGQISGGNVYGGDVYSYDANASLRREVTRQCMARKGYQITVAPTCTSSQLPKTLNATMSDAIKAPKGNFCVASISDHVGVPVTVK